AGNTAAQGPFFYRSRLGQIVIAEVSSLRLRCLSRFLLLFDSLSCLVPIGRARLRGCAAEHAQRCRAVFGKDDIEARDLEPRLARAADRAPGVIAKEASRTASHDGGPHAN